MDDQSLTFIRWLIVDLLASLERQTVFQIALLSKTFLDTTSNQLEDKHLINIRVNPETNL